MATEDDDYTIDVDLDEIDDGFEPIPDGPLQVRVATVTKKAGNEYPYFEVVMNPTEPPFQTRMLWLNLSISPKALWNYKAFCIDGCGLPSKRPNIKEAIGKVLMIRTNIVPSKKNPKRKVNEVVGGDYQAVA